MDDTALKRHFSGHLPHPVHDPQRQRHLSRRENPVGLRSADWGARADPWHRYRSPPGFSVRPERQRTGQCGYPGTALSAGNRYLQDTLLLPRKKRRQGDKGGGVETPLPAHQKAIKIAIVHIISGWHARTMRTADHGSAIRYPPFRTWPGKRILRHNTLASSRGCCRPCWLAASQAVCRPRYHPV